MNRGEGVLARIIEDAEEDVLIADGFDDAVMGIEHNSSRLIYSVSLCIEILMDEGMNMEDALEHFNYNVSGGYVGELTPIWCWDI
tara:strand:+ start:3770 stop:4024 length:255 start_codon:yes stop_codon:yes gene_type:complete